MGLFKSIKKGFKKLVKGVKKVFKKIGKALGKVLNSKWGKALMLAATVFTGGMALAGGIQGFMTSSAPTFFGKFAAGAKGFLTGLVKPVETAKGLFGGAAKGTEVAGAAAGAVPKGQELAAVTDVTGAAAQEGVGGVVADVAASGAEMGGEAVMGAAGETAEQALSNVQLGAVPKATVSPSMDVAAEFGQKAAQTMQGGGGGGGMLSRVGSGIQTLGEKIAQGAQTVAPEGGWLRQAASAGWDFINSPIGGRLLQGYGEGMRLEEEQKFEDRYRRAWRDPNNPFARREATDYRVGRPAGPVIEGGQTIQYQGTGG